MYLFDDRNGDKLALRPEGTASCVRVSIEHGLLYNQIQRLFYCGPMFRHERPQKGRYRQFHQFGVEAYGLSGPVIDLELMLIAKRFWQELGIEDLVTLQINTLGSLESRQRYRQCLVDYLQQHYNLLDGDSQRRLQTNPLRVLDSKNLLMQELLQGAPKLFDYLDEASRKHFDELLAMLDHMKVSYVINHGLVRGLDYYNLTVFEWVMISQDTLAQNTLCAGGRYDSLVATLGGKPTPAVGFAIGMERLLSLVSERLSPAEANMIYLITLGDQAMVHSIRIAEQLRRQGGKMVLVDCGGELKAQLKRADKSGAQIALILGDAELAREEITVKYLRDQRPQQSVKMKEILSLKV
jgi:histidyl-tRNA synthetase